MSVNQLEKLPCIVNTVNISKWLNFSDLDVGLTSSEYRNWLIIYAAMVWKYLQTFAIWL